MNNPSFSLIVPTIGIPELFIMLASVANKAVQPDQVIVVIDVKGRSLSSLTGSIEELEASIKTILPTAEILHNTEDNWQMNNQTFNIGISHARNPYVFVTHDDVVFPSADYFQKVHEAIAEIALLDPKYRVVGAVFPAYHENGGHTSPLFERDQAVCQTYSAVASLLNKNFWEEIGRFDEEIGIWWDVQMQGELIKHDVYMYYKKLTPILHRGGRALAANKCGQGWTHAPLWSNSGNKYQEHYAEYIAKGGKYYGL